MADGFKIEIKGLNELQTKFKNLEKEMTQIVAEGVADGGNVITTASKNKVHVITGRLKKSIRILHKTESKNRIEVQVGSDVPYAAVEEFRVGGKYPGPHSYLRYALDTRKPEVVKAIETKINKGLSRYK